MKCLFAILFLMSSVQAQASTTTKYKTGRDDGHLQFLAIGRPAMIRIKGESPGPQGQIDVDGGKAHGEFTLLLSDLNTGIDLRDEHMKKKYLEIDKNPRAILTITSLNLPASDAGSDLPFGGDLTLHGVTKKIEGHFSYETSQGTKKSQVEFKIHLSDFNIAIPNYAGMTVADEVQVEVRTNLRPE
ncbi:MAG: YceI family protein [Bdellovibrionales bacterium]|nr:YceI family protein [Bdellovibrionales bacterium]